MTSSKLSNKSYGYEKMHTLQNSQKSFKSSLIANDYMDIDSNIKILVFTFFWDIFFNFPIQPTYMGFSNGLLSKY